MVKQTSLTLLRLGINRGWIFKIFSQPFLYTIVLNYCLFIYLFLKMSFLKTKLWLLSYFIFFTFKKCVIHIFYWRAPFAEKKSISILSLKKLKFKKFLKWKKREYLHALKGYKKTNKLFYIFFFKNYLLFKSKKLSIFNFSTINNLLLKKKYNAFSKFLLSVIKKKLHVLLSKKYFFSNFFLKKKKISFNYKFFKTNFKIKKNYRLNCFTTILQNKIRLLLSLKKKNHALLAFKSNVTEKNYFLTFATLLFLQDKNKFLLNSKTVNLKNKFLTIFTNKNKLVFFLMKLKIYFMKKFLFLKFFVKKIWYKVINFFFFSILKYRCFFLQKIKKLYLKKNYFKKNKITTQKRNLLLSADTSFYSKKKIRTLLFKKAKQTYTLFNKNKKINGLRSNNFFLSFSPKNKTSLSSYFYARYLNILFTRITFNKFICVTIQKSKKTAFSFIKKFFSLQKNIYNSNYFLKNFKFFFFKKILIKILLLTRLNKTITIWSKIRKFFLCFKHKTIARKYFKLLGKKFFKNKKPKFLTRRYFSFKNVTLKNKNLDFLKKKIIFLRLEKSLDFFIPFVNKINLHTYNVLDYLKKSSNRIAFENKLCKKINIFLSKKILNIFENGSFSIRLFIKLLGWTFKLTGLCHLLAYYIALKVKTIKSHWALLRALELIISAYRLKYKHVIKGTKLLLKGKINNSLRTRKYILLSGSVNQQSYNSVIDYAQSESFNLAGIFTIRFWVQLK